MGSREFPLGTGKFPGISSGNGKFPPNPNSREKTGIFLEIAEFIQLRNIRCSLLNLTTLLTVTLCLYF